MERNLSKCRLQKSLTVHLFFKGCYNFVLFLIRNLESHLHVSNRKKINKSVQMQRHHLYEKKQMITSGN